MTYRDLLERLQEMIFEGVAFDTEVYVEVKGEFTPIRYVYGSGQEWIHAAKVGASIPAPMLSVVVVAGDG